MEKVKKMFAWVRARTPTLERTKKTSASGLAVILLLLLLIGWGLYERLSCIPSGQVVKSATEGKVADASNTKGKILLCPCGPEPTKPKVKRRVVKKWKPAKPVVVAVAPPPALIVHQPVPVLPMVAYVPPLPAKPKLLLEGVDTDYAKSKVVFIPLPEKEEVVVKERRVQVVVMQQPQLQPLQMQPQYSGGFGYVAPQVPSPYYYTSAPAYTPAQQVIVQAPPVFTQAPAAVVGRPPAGVLNGRAPAGVVGRAW